MATPYPAYGNSGYQTAYPVAASVDAKDSYGYAPPNPAYAPSYPASAPAPAYGVTPNTGGYAYSSPPPGAFQNNGVASAPYIPSPPKPKQGYIVCFAAVFILVSIAGVAIAVVNALNSNSCDTVELNKEIRNGDDYIGLIFTDCPSEDAVKAFTNAAERWSKVISANGITSFTEPAEFTASEVCPFLNSDLKFDAGTKFDHLIIVAETVDIDGVNGILAAAAPCGVDDNFFPVFGGMQFDNADIAALDEQGTLEAVVLHEMGHVLGIGTLWSSVKQGGGQAEFVNQLLIQDPIFNAVGVANANNIPKFIGQIATAEFSALSGSAKTFVPVEDGRNSAGNFFINVFAGEGQGSIDGHWKITTFNNELMVFAIDPDVNDHPLSSMTIKSLQDLGYSVDVTQADTFSLPTNLNSNLRGSESEKDILKNKIVLGNDIPTWFDREKLVPNKIKRSSAP